MSESSADKAFRRIEAALRSARSLLLVTHGRPDGDGLGAMVALAAAARAVGKTVRTLVPSGVPRRYAFLFPDGWPAQGDRFTALADAADLVVVIDTCAFAQLDDLEPEIHARREKIVVVDHHATTDDVGAVQWVDTTAAAAGIMVGELLDALGWPVDAFAAEALVTAVATDTGWMRFANTDARALHAVARWIDAGVRPDVLYRKLYQTDRPERLLLTIRMLESLELHCDGQVAALAIRREDFEETGALPEETENLINEALRLKTVETVVLLVENAEAIRVSLRSRDVVDVAEIAARFGGGGHARAAGVRLTGDMEALKQQLINACAEEIRKQTA